MAVINIGGDILTVRMNWPVPGLGIKGIAFSAVAGSLIAFCFNLYMFSRSELAGSLKKILPFSADYLRRLVNICLPTALQKFSWTLASFVLFFVLSLCPQSTSAIASWSIGMRVEALVFMPLLALSLAISAIIGQNLGAKQVERAKKAGWQMTGIGVALMLVLASLMYFNAGTLAMTMSHDPVAIGYTISYLQINALADPFLASGMILSGALQGAGDTRITMWISIFANWIIRLPLAYAFAIFFSLGPTGVWIAMACSQVLSACLLSARFKSGDWVKVQI
jgi:putative MATE family efflux protein